MKTPLLSLGGVAVLLSLAAGQASAADVLWNLDFKNLPPGQALSATGFAAPSAAPQRVTANAQDTLVGAASVGPLTNALLFHKETKATYTPAFTLSADAGYTSGVVTIQFDLAFDQIAPTPARPVETLMAFPLIKDNGGMDVIPVVACSGADALRLSVAGVGPSGSAQFARGQAAHVKMVLDLNQHTLQVSVNDAPVGGPIHDDAKLASFKGITFRDGSALGGNAGATFSAGLANISITKE